MYFTGRRGDQGINSGPTCCERSVSMNIMLASRSSIPFLVLLYLARAAKLDDKSLYHVVEDLPEMETHGSGKEPVATCSDVMARNGQIKLYSVLTQ